MPIQPPPANVLSRGLLLAATMLAGITLAHAQVDTLAVGEPGTWQSHETELVYMGFTTTYSCDGLQSKLELLLRQLGARSDAKVIAFGCDRGYGTPSRFARATLKFATLQPAAASARATSSDSASAPVDGSWRQVELAPHRPFGLQDGDCELMEQFRDKVLPLFATRALQTRTQCVPHQDTGGPFSLQLQVFAPVPAPKSK
jgi:hypothetical protein